MVMTRPAASISSLPSIVAIAVVAFAACDLVHEVLGHGVASALTPGVRALSLTTVALQTSAVSRFVASAGSVANVIAGLAAAVLFRRRSTWDPWTLFLGLFALTNLLNGTGYLIFSGLLNIGDWAVVIAGREPAWLWRALMSVAGALLYGLTVTSATSQAVALVQRGVISAREPARVLLPAYLAGGLLFVLGSALNPIGRSLILTSGVSSGFGAMAGLAVIPSLVEARTKHDHHAGQTIPLSIGWVVIGLAVALGFVGILGPGIRF